MLMGLNYMSEQIVETKKHIITHLRYKIQKGRFNWGNLKEVPVSASLYLSLYSGSLKVAHVNLNLREEDYDWWKTELEHNLMDAVPQAISEHENRSIMNIEKVKEFEYFKKLFQKFSINIEHHWSKEKLTHINKQLHQLEKYKKEIQELILFIEKSVAMCPYCGYMWDYEGTNKHVATCSICRHKVRLHPYLKKGGIKTDPALLIYPNRNYMYIGDLNE